MSVELPYELPAASSERTEALVALVLALVGASSLTSQVLARAWGAAPHLGRPLLEGPGLELAGRALFLLLVPALLALLFRAPRHPATMVLAALGLPFAFALASGTVYSPLAWLAWRAEALRLARHSQAARQALTQIHRWALGLHGGAVLLAGLRALASRSGQGHSQGSARFATSREIARLGLRDGRTGVVVGGEKSLGRPRYFHAPDRRHVGVFGPSGCGKTSKLVIPTLLADASSAVVLDIKMELYAATAGYRHQVLGHTLHAWAPATRAPWVSGYNPLLDIPKGPHEVAYAQALARTLVDPDGKLETQDFWQSSAASLLTAAILHVLYAEKDKSLAGVLHFLATPGKSLRHGLELLRQTEHDPTLEQHFVTLGEKDETPFHPAIALEAAKLLDLAPETLTGIVATARSRLSLFLDPIVAENTRRHDFSLAGLGDPQRPTSIYLVLPARDLGRLSGLLRLFLQALSYQATGELATETLPDGRLRPGAPTPRRLLLVLDELAAVGKLDLISRQLAYLRGYGLQILAAVQTANQLYDLYGQHESVRGNLAYLVVFPSTEQKTAEEISKLLGDQTLAVDSKSRSATGTLFASRTSTTTRDHKRPLLTPDEVRRLGNDHPLLIATGAHPIANTLPGYYELPALLARTRIPPPLPSRDNAPDVSPWTGEKAAGVGEGSGGAQNPGEAPPEPPGELTAEDLFGLGGWGGKQ